METTKFKKFQQFQKPSREEMEKLHHQWLNNDDLSMPGALCTESEYLRLYGWTRSAFFLEQSCK